MGYSHYWYQKVGAVPPEDWSNILERVHAVCAVAVKRGIQVVGPDGTGKPVFDDDEIAFNGLDRHESFVLVRDTAQSWHRNVEDGQLFQFCKTGAQPYDVVVTAALCVVSALLPDTFEVASDGNASDWAAGLELAGAVMDVAIPPRILNKVL